MAIKNIYKSRLGASQFVNRAGKALHFIDGRHITDNEGDILELEAEIKSGHPHIYIDPSETQIDTTVQDRLAKARLEAEVKVMEEIEAERKLKESSSDQKPSVEAEVKTMSTASLLGVTSTAGLASLMAGSASGGPAPTK